MEILLIVGVIFGVGYFLVKFGSSNSKPSIVKPPTDQVVKIPLSKPQLNVKKTDINSIDLNYEQNAVFKLIEESMANIYVTGKAGSGKSVLLQYFVEHTEKM